MQPSVFTYQFLPCLVISASDKRILFLHHSTTLSVSMDKFLFIRSTPNLVVCNASKFSSSSFFVRIYTSFLLSSLHNVTRFILSYGLRRDFQILQWFNPRARVAALWPKRLENFVQAILGIIYFPAPSTPHTPHGLSCRVVRISCFSGQPTTNIRSTAKLCLLSVPYVQTTISKFAIKLLNILTQTGAILNFNLTEKTSDFTH